ncbi:ABC transporter ATP-binding protein [Fictibacillus fluitans]|uniref:ABC transporter ATP-binding protein n=1 Tax=Fictibacillus fluitans TaxID=3058422 RepID=A0ABT8HUL2_9BACL|nr:ABC transporter ATP-binding protein [Fictibacillus sp. NE201]MDN4524456.1 ABC transporter ATP-binding protein [Fictibacillus sp. NE201]
MAQLLEVEQLKVSFRSHGGEVQAVRGVSFDIGHGEVLAVVGESGCGKSVTAQAIMKLLPKRGCNIKEGSIHFEGKDLLKMSGKEMKQLKGSQISMVFQDPMTSLNPTMKIGTQISEGIIKHKGLDKTQAKAKALELLKLAGIPNPESRYNQYPHELSGGMRQRVLIAIALACDPKLLIADEPTTALDVTIQAQILDLMKDLQHKFGTSIMLITHDLGVVAEMAQKVIVMYAGIVVESGTVADILERPKHPYTIGLLNSLPNYEDGEKERLIPIEGTPPDLYDPPTGCPFAARCEYAMEICVEELPKAFTVNDGHYSRCWLNDPRAPQVAEFAAAGRDES